MSKTPATNVLKLLFETLSEIQEIVYGHDKDRSSKKVLRLYNLTFVHGMEAKRIFKIQKSLTSRKMFGQYFHASISHAPQQYRVMAMSSTNAENEERSFHFLKKVSTLTSNHHAENVLINAFTRTQVMFFNINVANAHYKKKNFIIFKSYFHSILNSQSSGDDDMAITFYILNK